LHTLLASYAAMMPCFSLNGVSFLIKDQRVIAKLYTSAL